MSRKERKERKRRIKPVNVLILSAVLIAVVFSFSILAYGFIVDFMKPKPIRAIVNVEELWNQGDYTVLAVDFFSMDNQYLEQMTVMDTEEDFLTSERFVENVTYQIRKQFAGGGGELAEVKLIKDMYNETNNYFIITEEKFQEGFVAGQYSYN